MQDRVEELKTPDICSLTSETESGNANLELFSSKTLKELSQQKQPRENRFSNMSSENWKDWVTAQRQEYSQRVKLAHLTKEKESSSWATPNVCGNHNRKGASKTSGDGLSTQVKSWATPNTMDILPPRSYEAAVRQATTSRKGRTDPSNLREQVDEVAVQAYKDAIKAEENWATPRARDYKGGYRPESMIRKDGKSRMDALPQMVEYDPSSRLITDFPVDPESYNETGKHPESRQNLQRSKGQLNPDWVEQLMGLPIASTDLGSWGTELFHK
jgi:hypothetical protein